MRFLGTFLSIIKESLERPWPAAAFSLAGYLLAGIMPIIAAALVWLRQRKAEPSASNGSSLAAGQKAVNSCYAAGLALALLPILSAWALRALAAISQRQLGASLPANADFLKVLCQALLIYSISFFAGSVSESVRTHVASSILLAVAPIFVSIFAWVLCERFSFGFAGFDGRLSAFTGFPPIMREFTGYPDEQDALEAAYLVKAALASAAFLFALSSASRALRPLRKPPAAAKPALVETAACALAALDAVASGPLALLTAITPFLAHCCWPGPRSCILPALFLPEWPREKRSAYGTGTHSPGLG